MPDKGDTMKRAVVGIAFCALVLAGLFANHAQEAKPKLAKPAEDNDAAKDNLTEESNDNQRKVTNGPADGDRGTTYCPQFFEWQMYSGGTIYNWYRCQICDPPTSNLDDCTYTDVETTQTYQTGGSCPECGGGCASPPFSRKNRFRTARSDGDLPILDEVTKWTTVDYSWVGTNVDPLEPGRVPKSVFQEYYVQVIIDGAFYTFRCVEVTLPNTNDRLRVGVEINPHGKIPQPPAGSNAIPVNQDMTIYVGPEPNGGQLHHKVIAVVDGKEKVFHVVWVTAPAPKSVP
jgi:hypothetical protein